MKGTPLRISLIVALCLIISSGQLFCQFNSAEFAGNWRFNFSGALNGDGTMLLNRDGSILVYLSLGKYQRFFTNPISLRIAESGALNGEVLFWSMDVGKIVGLFSPGGDVYGRVFTPLFNVGVVTGNLTMDVGSGTYQSVAGNGVWTARKN